MNVIIIGSCAFDSMEYHLHDAFIHAGHLCSIVDPLDRAWVKGKYGNVIDYLARRYSDTYDKKLFLKYARKVCAMQPNLVICVYRFIHPCFVSYLKANCECMVIQVNPDALTTFEYQQIFASDYDLYFTKDPYIVRFMQDNMKLKVKLYHEAFNPRVHKKPEISKVAAEEKAQVDVMTYGTIYPYRSRMLYEVIKSGISLQVYGTKPNRFFDSKLSAAYQNRYLSGNEKAKSLFGAKVVFNQMHYAEIESVNNRFFEVNGCGAFQLSDYRPILKDLLPIDPELVSFRSIDEGIDKLRYYLAHPTERHEIADKVYRHFMENYTYDHLVLYLLNATF